MGPQHTQYGFSHLDINNGLMHCWGFAGNSVFNGKTITIPITFHNNYIITIGTLNSSNSVNMRVDKVNNSQIFLSRSGSYNVSGWYLCVGY